MNRLILLIPAAFLLIGADTKDDQIKKEMKKLEGTWIMESGEKDGAKIAEEHVKKSKITWKGKEVVVETPHQSKEAIKSTIGGWDPSKTPAEMDWVRTNGPDSGKTMLAIYEIIDNDHYRVCFAPAGKERPKEFSTKAGSGHFLHVWKRVKD
jgi:uncharacterized protein (TIGR03067 family)